MDKYERKLYEITEIHKQEKSLLIDKLDWKQTFTFGEKSKKTQDFDSQSTCSLRDEIDKLHFLIEEKDYMNAELKQEVTLLRGHLSKFRQTCYSSDESNDEFLKEIKSLKKEIRRLENDLNKTEENYNEQWILYKQKLNDERQRTIEAKEQMTELRDNYDKKINNFMKQLIDKEDEIVNLKGDMRESNWFQRLSAGNTPEEGNYFWGNAFNHNRSQTPTTSLFTHHQDTISIHGNMNPVDSAGNSIRSSMNLRNSTPIWLENLSDLEYKTLRKYQQMIDNANRIECVSCSSLLHPNDFYDHIKEQGKCSYIQKSTICNSPSVDKHTTIIYHNPNDSTPSLNLSLSGSKADFAYGHNPSLKNPKLRLNASQCKHLDDHVSSKRWCPISQSLQNSCKKSTKTKSITHRSNSKHEDNNYGLHNFKGSEELILASLNKLHKIFSKDTSYAEGLLKQLNSKFDKILVEKLLKDKTKFSIDLNKIAGGKGIEGNKKDKAIKSAKSKGNAKMKSLIEKILKSKDENVIQTDPSSSCKSQCSSNMSIKEERIVGNRKTGSTVRYGQIDEESSESNSNSLEISVNNPSIRYFIQT
jgi:hypothetical protein